MRASALPAATTGCVASIQRTEGETEVKSVLLGAARPSGCSIPSQSSWAARKCPPALEKSPASPMPGLPRTNPANLVLPSPRHGLPTCHLAGRIAVADAGPRHRPPPPAPPLTLLTDGTTSTGGRVPEPAGRGDATCPVSQGWHTRKALGEGEPRALHWREARGESKGDCNLPSIIPAASRIRPPGRESQPTIYQLRGFES